MEGVRSTNWFDPEKKGLISMLRKRPDNRYVPERVLHPAMMRERISCAPGVRNAHRRQDWTERMQSPENRGFYYPVTDSKAPQKIFSKEGIRWDVGISIIILIAAVAVTVLMIDVAGLFGTDAGSYRTRMNGIMAKNDVMSQELQKIANDNNAYREAIKHDLVYSGGIKTISLTAPENDLTVLKESSTEQ